MLLFKKEILIEIGRRQDMETIVADIDKEIADAETLYQKEYNVAENKDEEDDDYTSQNVKKLEGKVNSLAKTVQDLFANFDKLQ
jgi:hypothetical protein